MTSEFHHRAFLRKVGDCIDKAMKINHVTNSISSRRYARICIELKLRESLISSFKVESRSCTTLSIKTYTKCVSVTAYSATTLRLAHYPSNLKAQRS